MLTGLLRPTSGTATVAGYDIVQAPVEAKRRIGYVADGPYLYPKLTGHEFLQFIGDVYGLHRAPAARRADELLGLFDLADKADDIVEGYSHGMRQKLAIAAALLHDPEVLFLDEPTSGLDPRTARTVKDLLIGLSQRGRTVMFSTHVLEIAEQMCRRVGIIDHGRMIAIGTLDEVRGQARAEGSLEDIFLQLTGGPEAREIAAFLRGE
jgi:ABC-2 type transport system ATP-binding protein